MNIMESLLIGGDGSGHILHLYDSKLNKYSVQVPFISAASKEEKIIYVTAEADLVKEELEIENLDVDIIMYRPEEMGKISLHNKGRVIVDVSSFDDTSGIEEMEEGRRVIGRKTLYNRFSDYNQREAYLHDICDRRPGAYNILCSYSINGSEYEKSDMLMKYHDKVILTLDDSDVDMPSTILLGSANNIEERYTVRFVKNYLDMIVLALVVKKKMCGTDMLKCIKKSFDVSLSTGTLYPLLHDLEQKGLLDCDYGIRRRYKKKIYKPTDEERIKAILHEHLQSNNVLNRFLQSFPTSVL